MAWIRAISETEAEGDVKRQYETAVKRAGRVFKIVEIHSLRSDVMRTFMNLYLQLMHGPSKLSRREREMVATVVSQANDCHY
jgi:alkylhydroperoxidase family enzyme